MHDLLVSLALAIPLAATATSGWLLLSKLTLRVAPRGRGAVRQWIILQALLGRIPVTIASRILIKLRLFERN